MQPCGFWLREAGAENGDAAYPGLKLDALTYQMNRMSDRLDGHAKHLDQEERRVSEEEDEHNMLDTPEEG
ncbi:hypothetical protein NDU88_007619 [Pleurodeles waltl]|uniref:Uncharacterized protein n=1 Tax=Pleurodeles waltl TaxID=8319 RepID=A0AAV7VQ95_PLEWA|nr:hypothetical protein NDU88_007619 [Pleurodeles waltl]